MLSMEDNNSLSSGPIDLESRFDRKIRETNRTGLGATRTTSDVIKSCRNVVVIG